MKELKFHFLIVLLLILPVHLYADITGKIIVRGKWGSGEKEFGLDTSEPPGCGPSVFAVSPTGAIFIADDLNKRIVIYNHDGVLQRVIPIDKYVNTIDVDAHERIYYSHDNGFEIIDCSGQLIATTSQHGRVRLDNDKIYLWRDGISDELELNKTTNELTLIRKIDKTLNGLIIISNGIEFRLGPSSVSKSTGIAHITIKGKATQVRKRVGRNEEVIRKDSESASGMYSAIVDGIIVDGNDQGNVYLCSQIDCMYRLNAQGIITSEFKPPTKDDQHVIGQLGYAPSGYVRVKNGKIYYMGSTPYDPSRAIRVKRGSTNYLGSPNDEFMIIEYEFQPVGDTVEVENEEDGVKKI